MRAFRQIIDDPDEFIPVPPEVQHRRTEVIFLVQDAVVFSPTETNTGSVQDPDIAKFFGSIPDFPEREPQGELELREPLT